MLCSTRYHLKEAGDDHTYPIFEESSRNKTRFQEDDMGEVRLGALYHDLS